MNSKQSMKGSRGARQFLTAGVPMISFLLGGCYLLFNFQQTHVEMKDRVSSSVSTRKFNLEEEHKRLMKQLDIDNFSLSRIPRPDEERDLQGKRLSSSTGTAASKGSSGSGGSNSIPSKPSTPSVTTATATATTATASASSPSVTNESTTTTTVAASASSATPAATPAASQSSSWFWWLGW